MKIRLLRDDEFPLYFRLIRHVPLTELVGLSQAPKAWKKAAEAPQTQGTSQKVIQAHQETKGPA